MRKVIIIGSPGAGKSTFARMLRSRTGLPLYYLDMIYHRPDRTTIPREEFDAKLAALLAGDAWIIDGNYGRTIEARLRACDTVFLLDYPLDVCLAGLDARFGKPREDMPWVEDTPDEEFRRWVEDFPKVQLPRIYALLEQYKDGREVHVLHSRAEADEVLERIGTDT